MGIAGLGVAVCTAIASGTFIVALNHANVANVLFMQAASPIVAALLAWIALGEPITARAGVAMGIALLGVGLMVGGPGSGGLLGVGASFVMMVAFAVAIVDHAAPPRHLDGCRRSASRNCSLVLVAGPFSQPATIGERDLRLPRALGVCQMGLGLVLFTMGARLIVASEVALITLLEVVLGPVLGVGGRWGDAGADDGRRRRRRGRRGAPADAGEDARAQPDSQRPHGRRDLRRPGERQPPRGPSGTASGATARRRGRRERRDPRSSARATWAAISAPKPPN